MKKTYQVSDNIAQNESNTLKPLIYDSLFLIATIGGIVFLLQCKDEHRIIGLILIGIIFIQILVFRIISRFSNHVYRLTLDGTMLQLDYLKGNRSCNKTFIANETTFELREIKDSNSLFCGIRIIISGTSSKKSFNLTGSEWGYERLENIYHDLLKFTNSEVPESDLDMYRQLHYMQGKKFDL